MIIEDPDGIAPTSGYVSVPLLGSVLRAIRRRSRRRDTPVSELGENDSDGS